jgi:hypothetical protein
MTLSGTQTVGGSTLEEAVQLVEQYFKRRNLDPKQQEIPGSDGHGWWLTEGSAKVNIFVQNTAEGPALRVTSPIVFIPETSRENFYRQLLDLNNKLSTCHLATENNFVLVLAQRNTTGISQEEFDTIIWNVAYVADSIDDKLADKFGTQLYRE